MDSQLSLKEKNDRTVAEARAARRRATEAKWAAEAAAAAERNRAHEAVKRKRHGARIQLTIEDGCVFVFSDAHYAPGQPPSRAHKASIVLAKKLKPYAVINNGDAIDGASISRWPVSSFVEAKGRPTVKQELDETLARLKEYEDLKFVRFRVWNMGNHDARYETYLAEKVPQFAEVAGFTLKEHFPGWLPAWRTDFGKEVIVKHRMKGGMHAGQNNALWSGTSIVTGHDHMLKAYPITTAQGLRWGVHAGTMAPNDSPQFTHYTEDNVVNWQEGFAILHFRGGRFTGPELVHVTPDGRALFRGDAVKI